MAWSPSEGPGVAGYLIYQGASSGNYTNVIDVGSATSVSVSNLVAGTTYYFAASAYDVAGLESVLSAEISYTVAAPRVSMGLTVTAQNTALLTCTGPAGHRYDLLASPDLQKWIPIANLMMDVNGTCQFVDSTSPVSATQKRFYRLNEILH